MSFSKHFQNFGAQVENMNAERGLRLTVSRVCALLLPVYNVTKLSGTYGMNLVQYQANKRTPFPPASTKTVMKHLEEK